MTKQPKNKKPPFTAAELRKKIRSGECVIKMAPQNTIVELQPYVDRIMAAIEDLFEVGGALVSDESYVSDFVPRDYNSRAKDTRLLKVAYSKLSKKLGLELNHTRDRSLVQIAYKLKRRDKALAC